MFSTAAYSAAAALYLLLLLTVSIGFWHLFFKNALSLKLWTDKRISSIFFSFSLLFGVFRVIWSICNLLELNTNIGYVTNRIALVFFFTLFTSILFWLFQILKGNYGLKNNGELKLVIWKVLVGINLLMYLFEIVILILYFSTIPDGTSSGTYSTSYNIDVFLTAITYIVLSIAFFFYVIILLQIRAEDYEEKKRMFELFATSIVFSLCSVSRAIMWFWRPITGEELPETLYVYFSYFVPEIFPILISVLLIYQLVFSLEKKNRLTHLYFESDTEGGSVHF